MKRPDSRPECEKTSKLIHMYMLPRMVVVHVLNSVVVVVASAAVVSGAAKYIKPVKKLPRYVVVVFLLLFLVVLYYLCLKCESCSQSSPWARSPVKLTVLGANSRQ